MSGKGASKSHHFYCVITQYHFYDLIKNNSEDVILATCSGKCDIWKHFKTINYKGNQVKNKEACVKCSKMFHYNSKSGSCQLKRHIDACIPAEDEKQMKLSPYLKRKISSNDN